MKGESPKDDPSFRKKILLIGVACFFLVMVVTSVFGKKGVMDINRARRDLAALDARVLELKLEKTRLEAEIQDLEKNPKAVEKEARKTLWLIEPGEKVIVIPKTEKK